MAVFSDGGSTSPDIYIGVSCIILLLLCTGLNSRVFYHNNRKQRSVARTLYLCLSAADLATSWVLLGVFTYHILEDSDSEECTEDNCGVKNPSTLASKIYTLISFPVSFAPAHITAFLAMTRFLQIKFPLQPINLRYVIGSLLCTLAWIPIVVGSAMFVDTGQNICGPFDHSTNPFSWNFCPEILGLKLDSLGYYIAIILFTVVLQIGAMVASIFTTYELVNVYLNPVTENMGREENMIKGSMKIMLTNLGSFFHVLIIVIAATESDVESDSLVTRRVAIIYLSFQTFVPALISTLNPIIYIFLTNDCDLKLWKCM